MVYFFKSVIWISTNTFSDVLFSCKVRVLPFLNSQQIHIRHSKVVQNLTWARVTVTVMVMVPRRNCDLWQDHLDPPPFLFPENCFLSNGSMHARQQQLHYFVLVAPNCRNERNELHISISKHSTKYDWMQSHTACTYAAAELAACCVASKSILIKLTQRKQSVAHEKDMKIFSSVANESIPRRMQLLLDQFDSLLSRSDHRLLWCKLLCCFLCTLLGMFGGGLCVVQCRC